MSAVEAPAKRRTQEERRAGTIRALLDAAIDTLIDHGYAATSVQRICERAALSQGALFRHFATREALMVAVGEDVGAQLLARYARRFRSEQRRGEPDLAAALHLVREACRSRLNQAWYELTVAARTSDALRAGLQPVAARYHADIARLARELLPELASALGPAFDAAVGIAIAMFDGEVLQRTLVRDPAGEDARIALLVAAFARAR